jgi:hypothetical protein
MKKSQAFGWGLLSVLATYASAIIAGAAVTELYGPTLLAIVGLTTTYIGGNVADNGVKGKFYNPALEGL